ncbi:unnamed protein product [Rotaria sp. Silwood1]|nr:unnamed protein product [Rotaria sp. Silwood1]CAF4698723.1 unnamed protein product [Rotaria sp. Silwood1]
MMHSVIRRSPSIISSTVADPSKVTVRIESASASDLNVQDVVTTSSSSDDDDLQQQQRQQNNNDRFNYRISSANNRRHTPSIGINNNNNNSSSSKRQRPSRLTTDVTSSTRISQNRPITAVSLPAKPSAYDNEWDLDSARVLVSSVQRRNPSCPLISPTNVRAPPSSQSIFTHQLVPTVFTTTSECLGKDLRPQPRRDIPRRAQSLAKSATIDNNSISSTTSIVFLTHDILLGSIRALQNERQLCKLSIDYLIDATNMRPDELARKANVGARLQCHCGHTHSRCTLTLEFDQLFLPTTSSSSSLTTITTTTTIDYNNLNNNKIRELTRLQLSQLFSAVNGFIYKSQQEGKRILIYGFELTPNSPLAVIAIQYLMLNDEQLSLNEATNRIHRLFPIIPIQHQEYPIMEKRFQDYLKQLDRKKFSKNFNINNIMNEYSTNNGNENRQISHDFSSNSSETTTNNTPVTSWTTIPMSFANDTTNSSHHVFSARSAWDS